MSDRQAKEAFVTGHAGTTVGEVNAVTHVPLLLLSLLWLLSRDTQGTGAKPAKETWKSVVFQFVVLIVPQIAQLTDLVSASWLFIGLLASAGLLLYRDRPSQSPPMQQPGIDAHGILRKAISAYRGILMLGTCLAILAVDFPAFPRRFAKAETFGTGLMDTGVGSVVVCSALVRGIANSRRRIDTSFQPYIREALRFLALLALGVGKVLVINAADYQVHVGEYGVHWNFFLTLAAVRFGSWLAFDGLGHSAMFGLAVFSVHQFLLTGAGLLGFIHSDVRGPGLLLANKEGLLSLLGYVALHYLGVVLGHVLGLITRRKKKNRKDIVTHCIIVTSIMWALFFGCQIYEPVSRRACNATYMLWMLALNVQLVTVSIAVVSLKPGKNMPILLQSFSDNMLVVFLAANVATGLTNIYMDTLNAPHWLARTVLTCYMLFLTLLAYVFCSKPPPEMKMKTA